MTSIPISIPVAWVISILALLLAAIVTRQVRLPVFARLCFAVALGSVVVVTFFLGVRFQFNDPAFIAAQPYVATVTAPAFWLGFRTLATQDDRLTRRVVRALLGSICAAWALITLPFPWTATAAVILINCVYALLLLNLLRLPAERFVHVPPSATGTLKLALAGCLLFLGLVLATDISVLVTGMLAGESQAMALLSGASALGVVAISLSVMAGLAFAINADRDDAAGNKTTPCPQEEDRDVFARLETLMAETGLYRDPELTVARLGRRLGVPARAVSSAVNRITGENVSRYINGLRVRHAVDLLTSSDLAVTDVMLEAGFQSKSSFNTEFRRITGTTPSAIRSARSAAGGTVRHPKVERPAS